MTKIISAILSFIILLNAHLNAQSLLQGMEDSIPPNEKVSSAFKSTRVINAHSIEMLHKGNLDFRIMHRFGEISSGIKELYGLDQASMRLSFDYGITDNITAGFGRSTYRKELDLFVKTRIIQQSTGQKAIPFSLVVAAGAMLWNDPYALVKPVFSDRTSYYVQLLAGRKFSSAFSFQISPIIIRSSNPSNPGEDATIFAMGAGARLKVSKRIAITADYHHPFKKFDAIITDPLSLGVDIETGGHVFQLQFSNAVGMNERAYITETRGDFFKGDIRFGFNLSRIFRVGKK